MLLTRKGKKRKIYEWIVLKFQLRTEQQQQSWMDYYENVNFPTKEREFRSSFFSSRVHDIKILIFHGYLDIAYFFCTHCAKLYRTRVGSVAYCIVNAEAYEREHSGLFSFLSRSSALASTLLLPPHPHVNVGHILIYI